MPSPPYFLPVFVWMGLCFVVAGLPSLVLVEEEGKPCHTHPPPTALEWHFPEGVCEGRGERKFNSFDLVD